MIAAVVDIADVVYRRSLPVSIADPGECLVGLLERLDGLVVFTFGTVGIANAFKHDTLIESVAFHILIQPLCGSQM